MEAVLAGEVTRLLTSRHVEEIESVAWDAALVLPRDCPAQIKIVRALRRGLGLLEDVKVRERMNMAEAFAN